MNLDRHSVSRNLPREAAHESAGLRWIVSQEGSRQSYGVPLAFHRLGALRKFYVDTWCRRGRNILRRGPKGLRALSTHFNAELPSERVVSFNSSVLFARAKLYFQRNGMSLEQISAEYCRFGKHFAELVREELKREELNPDTDAFFGFNTNCLETIEYLRGQGVFTVVDQVDPGKVEEDLCVEEAARWPGWAKTPGRMPQSYWDRLTAEWDAADAVLVNSPWSAEALIEQGVPASKIMVVPLAIDVAGGTPVADKEAAAASLKVLWLGSVILRKGIQYLVEAARILQKTKIEFLVAGPVGISATAVSSFPPNMRLLGRITRDQLTEIYRQSDVFVLPTLSDGFAITQLEAMAEGLPVVVTPNCGRVVTDGVDGLIVPARNGAVLADALVRLDEDRELLQRMSANARLTVQHYNLPANGRLIQQLAAECRRPRPELTLASHA